MSIEQNLERIAAALETIAKSGSAPVYTPAGADAAPVAAGVKPRGRPAGSKNAEKATTTAAPVEDASKIPADDARNTSSPAAEAAKVTAVDLRALVMKCIAAKQRTAAVAILAETGADGVGTLHPIHYEAVAAKLNALLVAPAEEAAE